MRILLFFSIVILSAIPALSQVNPQGQKVLAELGDPNTTQAAASDLIVRSQTQPEIRMLLNNELPKMLLQNKYFEVLQSETTLAGVLKLQSTIPALVQLLSKPLQDFHSQTYRLQPRTFAGIMQLRDDPPARALAEIGEPSVAALEKPLNDTSAEVRKRAMRILLRIDSSESQEMLSRHLAREDDSGLRSFLIANKVQAVTP